MKLFFQNLAVAFAMYSKIPMPHFEWNEKNMKYSMCFFPLIGAVIGGIMIGLYCLLNMLALPASAKAAIFVIVPVIISGGLHVDGLLDTSDAISSFQTMERRLEILKDTHAGAFAIIIGVLYFIVDFGFKFDLSLRVVLVIACGYMVSRGLSAFAVVSFRKAGTKSEGLVKTFSKNSAKSVVRVVSLIYVLVGCGLMLYVNLTVGICAIIATAIAFVYYRIMAYKRFGGINGDLAGYFTQVCELLILIAAVIGDKLCV